MVVVSTITSSKAAPAYNQFVCLHVCVTSSCLEQWHIPR